jgi:guanylate kinase
VSSQKPVTRNQIKKQGLIFVVSGPSGSGKTTLLKKLLNSKGLKDKLAKSVSFTTRPKRAGEKNGKDYFFTSPAQFKALQKAERILEWTKYLGYYYATSKDFISRRLRQGKNIALCLDVNGARKLKQLYPDRAVTIFILPPSLKALKDRIKKRGCKTKAEEIKLRMRLARKELLAAQSYDYGVANKDFAQAVKRLKKIVLTRLNV